MTRLSGQQSRGFRRSSGLVLVILISWPCSVLANHMAKFRSQSSSVYIMAVDSISTFPAAYTFAAYALTNVPMEGVFMPPCSTST